MRSFALTALLTLVVSPLISCSSSDDSGGAPNDAAGTEEDMVPDGERGDQGGPLEPGNSDSDSASTEPGAPPETSEPDTATCAEQEDWDPAWTALEDEILEIVNQRRTEGASCGGEQFAATDPLVMDEALRCAARLHSKDMAEQDYFSHNSLDGRSPWERIAAAGFEMSAGGENIAAGHQTAGGTMEGWMDSPGHCSNIMSADFDFIGVGYYPGGDYGHMWTQTFGSEGESWQ